MPYIDTEPPFESTLPELTIPSDGFKSTIPEHLLSKVGDEMKWLMQEVSKNTNATEFSCRAAVEHNRHLRTLNGRTFKNEKAMDKANDKIDALEKQAKTVTPIIKPLTFFAALWEYRAFRWIFSLGVVFLVFVLYPYYLAHPTVVVDLAVKMFGG